MTSHVNINIPDSLLKKTLGFLYIVVNMQNNIIGKLYAWQISTIA